MTTRRKQGYIRGNYFLYCQWCHWDGRCRLKHHRFLGVQPGKGVDHTPYTSHEDVEWHATAFQGHKQGRHLQRAMCRGRIYATDSVFYPLACQCGTVISSLTFSSILGGCLCGKFMPSKRGEIEMKRFEEIIKQEEGFIKKDGGDLDSIALLREFNLDYHAVMEY